MRYKEQYGYEILSNDVSFIVFDDDNSLIAEGEFTMGPEGFEVTLLWCGHVSLAGIEQFASCYFQKIWRETFN